MIRLYRRFLTDHSIPPAARAILSLLVSYRRLPKGAILGSDRMATILGLPPSTVRTNLALLKEKMGVFRQEWKWMGIPPLTDEEERQFIEMDETILRDRKWSCRVVFAELCRQMICECITGNQDGAGSPDPYTDKVESVLSIAEISRNTGFERHTVKKDIAELCAAGYVLPASVQSGEPFHLCKPPEAGRRKQRKPSKAPDKSARRARIRQRLADRWAGQQGSP